jgi:hydrogenase-4 component B
MSLQLVVAAIALSALSGVPGLFMGATSVGGQRLATILMVAGAALGLSGALSPLFSLPVNPEALGAFLRLDSLSAFFLVPVFLMGGLGSFYGLGYWPAGGHARNAHKTQLFWGLLTAGMATLVVSRQAFAFLVGWEFMALSAFFLVSTEDHLPDSRRAGWIYFIATHIGTLTLFAFFALWRRATGSFAFDAAPGLIAGAADGLFFLALLGFGLKAGMMPLHFWLPGAHAAAPSHVSANLSGVVLKMGVYGLVRFASLLPDPPVAWGILVLGLGAVSGLLGIVFAIGQRDLKRLLAYSSVENVGIILMGLGLALLGRTLYRTDWIVLGLAACLLHTWNHAFFKPLLFMGAGAVVHGTHTRRIDRLGGLAKLMPFTSLLFLAGSLAVCALPPFNGFVSEAVLYRGLFAGVASEGIAGAAAAFVAPVLAAIGALAVAAFVKAWGGVFLGTGRTEDAEKPHEAPWTMLLPMTIYAALCAAIGLAPVFVAPILDRVIACWLPGSTGASVLPAVASLLPLKELGFASFSLIAVLTAVVLVRLLVNTISQRKPRRGLGTWDCGYAAPDSRMQYGGSSFTQPVVALFSWLLKPRTRGSKVEGAFPLPVTMRKAVDDAVLDRLLVPAARFSLRRFIWIRRFQQGQTQQYLLYILVIMVLMLGALIPVGDLVARVFAR